MPRSTPLPPCSTASWRLLLRERLSDALLSAGWEVWSIQLCILAAGAAHLPSPHAGADLAMPRRSHVPAIYGPPGDVKWAEDDQTYSVERARPGGRMRQAADQKGGVIALYPVAQVSRQICRKSAVKLAIPSQCRATCDPMCRQSHAQPKEGVTT